MSGKPVGYFIDNPLIILIAKIKKLEKELYTLRSKPSVGG